MELEEQTENLRTKTYLFTATHTCTNQLFQGHVQKDLEEALFILKLILAVQPHSLTNYENRGG